MRIIDLTSKIYAGMSVFPGDPGVTLDLVSSHGKDVCQVTELRFGSHTGTHLDAPIHFFKDKKSLSELPLDTFVGEAVCLRAKLYYAGGEAHPVIELADSDKCKIRPGDRVIISTGWEEKSGTDAFFRNYPIFSAELLVFLMNMKIRMIGSDIPTVEAVESAGDPLAMHRMILSRGIVPVEGLVNLSGLTGRRFFFSAAPLLLENGDGSPVRAYAMVEE
jgi:kynurenine formamidase